MSHACNSAAPSGCWPTAIPKHIYLSFTNKTDVPAFVLDSWRQLNPGFRVTLFDDDDCATFVSRHYGAEMAANYRNIPSGAIRADLWRVMILLQKGGVYVDIDAEPLISLHKVVMPTDIFVTSGSRYREGLNPHLIISEPGEPILKATLRRILHSLPPYKKFDFASASVCLHMFREFNKTYGEAFSRHQNDGLTLRARDDPRNHTYGFLREKLLRQPRIVKATISRAGEVVCYNKWNASVWDMCHGGYTWPNCPHGGFRSEDANHQAGPAVSDPLE